MDLLTEVLLLAINQIALVLLILFFLTVYFMITFTTARSIIFKILWKRITGKEMILSVNPDGSFDLPLAKKSGRWLRTKDSDYGISPGSIIRGAEWDMYVSNSALGRTLTPESIKAANNLRQMGYSNLSHAVLSYQAKEHKEDYDRIVKAGLENKENDIVTLLEEFDKQVYSSMMDPMKRSTDFTTQNLAVLNEWSNQQLSAYENRDIVEHERLMALKEQKLGGLPLEKLLGYGAFFCMIIGGLGGLVILLKSQGML